MTLPAGVWEQVRQRARCACEYCGITEVDTGGLLTVDHYRPYAHDGTDELDNLIYSCFRCNNHKGDYWPVQASDPLLWNPREESAEKHLLLLPDGSLHPISTIGSLTLNCLQLNRVPLVAHRLQKVRALEKSQRAARLKESMRSLEQLRHERVALTEDQAALLDEHRRLLELFLSDPD